MGELNARIKDIRLPYRMRHLPISDKGFPVPFFVSWFDAAGEPMPTGIGTPDFRCIGPNKVADAHRRELCWICGQPRGRNMAFVIGPMCAVNRISSEPPCHLECALYAVRACPFLTQPRMVRNEKGLPDERYLLDGAIERNPGVTVTWVTRAYKVSPVDGGVLFRFGDPVDVTWWREGRRATRAEVLTSIDEGLPALREVMERDGLAEQLPALLARTERLVPA